MTPDIETGAASARDAEAPPLHDAGVRRAAVSAGGVPSADRTPADAGLRRRYEAYRRRQGAELLSLVPREGIRPLYRAACDRAVRRGQDGERPAGDAVGMLAEFCSELLPLPPFEVWKADFDAHRAAHLDEADDWAPAPADRPVTVEIRRFAASGGAVWYASLDVRRTAGAWRGSLAFHGEEGGRVFRTGEVFREADATAVRARFLEFDEATLQAFLRSVLP